MKKELKISNTALALVLLVKVLFLPKNAAFLQRNAGISRLKRALVLKVTFSETTYLCVFTYQVSSS